MVDFWKDKVIVAGCLLTIIHTQSYALPRDFDQEILFHSNNAHFNYKNNSFKAAGDIKIQQGSILVEAQQASGILNNNGGLEKIILTAQPVKFQQQLKVGQALTQGQAQRIHYVAGQDKIELHQNAKLHYNNMLLEAESIVYGLTLGDVEIKGTPEKQIKITIPPQQKIVSKPLNHQAEMTQ